MKSQIEIINEKIVSSDQFPKLLRLWRFRNQKIVFTNGCFDILHRGHIEYLAEAASYGNKLIIGLNSDSSVKRLKGPERPVNPFSERALLLAALRFTDLIVEFEEDTPENLISLIMPDVLVKGGDYTVEQIAGADRVLQAGGEVKIVPLTEGYSTTGFLKRLS